MDLNLKDEDIEQLYLRLRQKNLKISVRKIKTLLGKIVHSHQVFPLENQQALVIHLLHTWDITKKKEVIILEECEDKEIPNAFVLGVLAEDWPGMSNSILGIVHHKQRNVLVMKGFTLDFMDRKLGIVILTFQLKSADEYAAFVKGQKNLILEIKEAARWSNSKYMLLDDEAVKFEIYNKIIKKVKELYHNSDLVKVIDESGEVLKFVSSRSREYLEERKINDLAHLILDNYVYQNMVRSGSVEEIVKVKNFETTTEELTGISFVCKEQLFSIEDFLKTLNHIVPDHIIKHHKSYVTRDNILVYRIEILDRNEKPLDMKLIKPVEASLDKLISIACNKKSGKLNSVGGFEHYARAIIPFLSEELKRTMLTQVFINVDSKSEFLNNIKLVIVAFKSRKKRIYQLISKLSLIPGIEINSTIPTKIHHNKIEINILKLRVTLSEFPSIKDIYNAIKSTIRKIYGDIRDFDEGFRDIYIRILNQLLDHLKTVDAALIREIFFNIDELYKIEISPTVLLELIRTCSDTVEESRDLPSDQILIKHKQLHSSRRTLLVISYCQQKKLLSKMVGKLTDVDLYFTQFEWDQRFYLVMILSKNNDVLGEEHIKELMDVVRNCGKTCC